MKTIKKSIIINASKEKVWDVLVLDELNRVWYAEFAPGSHARTDWKVGSKVIFADDKDSGIIGKIIAHDTYKLLSMEYNGVLVNGMEDYESDEAKAMKGAQEIYRLSEENGVTRLDAQCDMDEGFFDMMASAWDKAMLKIKELAEAK